MKILRVFSGVPFVQECEKFFIFHKLSQDKITYDEAIEHYKNNDLYNRYSFSQCFKQLKYDCLEIMIDIVSLQKKWCKENNQKIEFSENDWIMTVFEKQLEVFKPDIIFFDRSSSYLPFYYIDKKALKQKFPFIKILAGFWGSSLVRNNFDYEQSLKLISNVDVLFCQDRSSRKVEKKISGVKAFLLPHCFDISNSIIKKLSYKKNYDFTFLGTSGFKTPNLKNRYFYLSSLLKKKILMAWLKEETKGLENTKMNFSFKKYYDRFFLKLNRFRTYEQLEKRWKYQLPLTYKFSKRTKPFLIGEDYYEMLSQSKITFNIHGDFSGHIGNMRCYEATGIGSCMLVDKPNLIKDLFLPDEEVVCYKSIGEAESKVKYLLKNPKICEEIARRGQTRTLKDHTMKNRAEIMDNIFRKLIN